MVSKVSASWGQYELNEQNYHLIEGSKKRMLEEKAHLLVEVLAH
jgi:hypothetical protein